MPVDEPANPAHTSYFGTDAVMPVPQPFLQPIRQPG
jgi:hypothetical protein